MVLYPFVIALVLAIIDWIAVERNWKPLEYVAKPVTMIAIIWGLGMNVGPGGPVLWFTIGAILGLVGDIFLMFPDRMFILGLLAFLLGHIAYIIGLNNQAPYTNLLGAITIIALGIFVFWLFPKLSAGLAQKGKNSLRLPVLIYSLVISLMVYSAIMTWTRPGWPIAAALSVSIGALLFLVSDSLNAWERFVNPLPRGRLLVMVTYHLGQLGIILGAILHFLQK